jgi:peptidoglycan/xylan/chitin deacetylase (PgdA/CDA1 family)
VRSRKPLVLAYHAIAECPREEDTGNLFVSPAAFERQMSYLKRHCVVVPLADALGRDRSARRKVAITFDDGYVSVLTTALPILEHYGFVATVFVPTAAIGRRNTWDPPSRCPLDIMSEDQLLRAAAAGLDVQSHGHAHIDMSRASADEVRADLRTSSAALEKLLRERPRYLAYPFGTSSQEACAIAAGEGLHAAFTIDLPGAGRFASERVQVTPLDNPLLFALKARSDYLRLRWHPLVARSYSLLRPLARRTLHVAEPRRS